VSIKVDLRPAPSEDLLVRAQRGEAEAFTALVDEHHAELVRVAYVVCGDIDLALDAAQAAWIKAWQQLRGLRDEAKLRPWLIAIAANEARQSVRARRRRSLRELPMPMIEPAVGAPGGDSLDLLAALARLDPLDRELLAMRYLAGLSSDDIARATGRSASGVRARLSRLTSRLREDLSHD
jgi:RNA polymerase sigma-70 factor (ECF subfamily)